MKHYLQLTKQFLLVITPLLASSVLAASPSLAATFASLQGEFEFTGFSQSPSRVSTSTDSNTSTIGPSDSVIALAQAQAFFVQKFPAQAFNTSLSLAFGENEPSSEGQAESEASLLGVFNVKANTTFSFDFAGSLNLLTSIDNPPSDNARASGDISFTLFDTATNDILEFFSLWGNLNTKGNDDFITYEKSDNVTLNNLDRVSNFGGTQESATASVEGFVKRTFASPTNLALIEVKSNKVTVKTPEPSINLAIFLSCGAVGLVLKRKRQEKTVMDAFANKV